MEPVKIELRNFKYFPTLSDETNAFTANIYVNGKLIGTAENSGKGGPTNCQPLYNVIYKQPFELAEKWCEQLPDIVIGQGTDHEFRLKMNLENYVDELVNAEITRQELAKLQKRFEKDMTKRILVGEPQPIKTNYGYKLNYSYYTLKAPISELIKTPNEMKGIVAIVKAKLQPGEQILNTNLPKEWL